MNEGNVSMTISYRENAAKIQAYSLEAVKPISGWTCRQAIKSELEKKR